MVYTKIFQRFKGYAPYIAQQRYHNLRRQSLNPTNHRVLRLCDLRLSGEVPSGTVLDHSVSFNMSFCQDEKGET